MEWSEFLKTGMSGQEGIFNKSTSHTSSNSSQRLGWIYQNFYSISEECDEDFVMHVKGEDIGTCRQIFEGDGFSSGSRMYRYDDVEDVVYAMEFKDLKCRERRTQWMKRLRVFKELEIEMILNTCEKLSGTSFASKSQLVTQQQRLPLSGSYVLQLGFNRLQDCRETRFMNHSHSAPRSTSFSAYASNVTCEPFGDGKFVKYDCSLDIPFIHTFTDHSCTRKINSLPISNLCSSSNGDISPFTYWTCSQGGIVLPLPDTREDHHIVTDTLIGTTVMIVILIHFAYTLYKYCRTSEDEPVQLIALPSKDLWVPNKRMNATVKNRIDRLNARILELETEVEGYRTSIAGKNVDIDRMREEIISNVAALNRMATLENELNILRSRDIQWRTDYRENLERIAELEKERDRLKQVNVTSTKSSSGSDIVVKEMSRKPSSTPLYGLDNIMSADQTTVEELQARLKIGPRGDQLGVGKAESSSSRNVEKSSIGIMNSFDSKNSLGSVHDGKGVVSFPALSSEGTDNKANISGDADFGIPEIDSK